MSKKTYVKLYCAADLDAQGNPTRGNGPYKTFTLHGVWSEKSVTSFLAKRPWLNPAKIVIVLI